MCVLQYAIKQYIILVRVTVCSDTLSNLQANGDRMVFGLTQVAVVPSFEHAPCFGHLRGQRNHHGCGGRHRCAAFVPSDPRRRGIEVIEATNGLEALVLAEAHPAPIQILVSDVDMPKVIGLHLAERIEAVRPGIGVVLVTGGTSGLLFEGPRFLRKPFPPDKLVEAVEHMLAARRKDG